MSECPHCGNPSEVCSDPMAKWYPYRSICYATMARQAANETYDDLHKSRPYHDGQFENWGQERSERFPFHARDGVTIGVADRDLAPDDYFLGRPQQISEQTLGSLS